MDNASGQKEKKKYKKKDHSLDSTSAKNKKKAIVANSDIKLKGKAQKQIVDGNYYRSEQPSILLSGNNSSKVSASK